MPHSEINRKLLSSRKELLDIGLRNNMLNFRLTAKSLSIVDELSEEVLKLLYRQNKLMTFAGLPEARLKQLVSRGETEAEEDKVSESTSQLLNELEGVNWTEVMGNGEDDAENGDKPRRHTDTRLQTAMTEERLFLYLLKIQAEAESFIQEQGVNVLFLALGFLHWFEADSSDKKRKAPLLLLPVHLKRAGSKEAFRLEYSGDDLVQNLSLAAKLKTDFALELPQYIVDSSADAEEMPPLEDFFSEVNQCISKQSRWSVAPNEICLGFFSFGKFLMFNDLDPGTWPADKQPEDHPVLGRLLGEGFSDESPAFEDGVHIDTVLAPGDAHFVKDADSSQTLAILEARAGRNLVIQGPPGTGKSQTITNIIAECLGQGKTVLFVAEKMAALEVVKRRLDETHLGDAVLELHSHKATKVSVLKELARTLDQGKPLARDGAEELHTLSQVRDQLNQYCEAVNAQVGKSGIPFIAVLGHYLRLKREHAGLPSWSFTPMCNWTHVEHNRHRQLVSEMALQLEDMGRPSHNPFWGTKRESFSPLEHAQAGEFLDRAITQLQHMESASVHLAGRLGLAQPVTLADVRVVCRAARRAAEAPKLTGVQLSTDDWQSRRDAIRELVEAGQRMSMLQAQHAAVLIEQAWEQNLLTDRQHLINYGEKWWRVFSTKYRKTRARLRGLCTGTLPKDNKACLTLVDGILDFQQRKRTYDQYAGLGEALFGAQWNQQRSDWEVLSRLSEWVIALYDDLGKGELPSGIVDFLAGHPDAGGLGEAIEPIEQEAEAVRVSLLEVLGKLELSQHDLARDLPGQPLQSLHEHLRLWRDELDKLYQMARFNQLSTALVQAGLTEVAEQAAQWSRVGSDIVRAFDLTWYSGLVELAYAGSPQLRQFDRIKQEHLVARFRHLDQASLGHAQTGLAKAIWERMPSVNQPGEMDILRRELNKKRRHIPIRQLMNSAGQAIQQIKPVFMMSPMSIASFLPPGRLEFDVVVFDEASQVKAVDAFGAILRGHQIIVVGDTRQMPPTDFFSRDIETDDEDNTTSDIESVLAMFRARGTQERYLSWHYRSRHESLIAVSNVEFYDRKLVVFPSPGTNPHATGLKLHYLPDAFYDRGRTRTNREEARAAAKAVMAHAATMPHLSLGVVAFSMAQRDLIQVEVELLRRDSPALEAFFTQQHQTEPFFIKNLENVQGDERDVILISIGYGRNETGRIAKEFGPLNRDGGERRLNVLITRAKLGMEVFSNFRADELELDASARHGVRALKHFLKYAETGELDIPWETGREADSPFELEVMLALRERGYQLELQVGTAGYFIDIGVKDPDYPGRYVLAIECDGASYHSSRSARDRDRLRQEVLESLGWRFHRIWSTDWFRNPGKETERAVAVIEAARKAAEMCQPVTVSSSAAAQPTMARVTQESAKTAYQVEPYRKARLPSLLISHQDLHTIDSNRLAHEIKAVVDVEAPVHEADVTRRLIEAYGLSRAGNRIAAKVSEALKTGTSIGLFFYANGFVYTDKQREVRIRSREALETTERKIELVAPEEIDAALLEVVRLGFSMKSEAAISGALEMLGFGRVTGRMKQLVGARIDKLLATNRLIQVDTMLRKGQ
jgi:very-short-patch-repair endonuclease